MQQKYDVFVLVKSKMRWTEERMNRVLILYDDGLVQIIDVDCEAFNLKFSLFDLQQILVSNIMKSNQKVTFVLTVSKNIKIFLT
jgi:hypothetical protein